MIKTFPGLLEYFVVTYSKKEAGYSGETLRSYYASVEQYVHWLKDNEQVPASQLDASYFNKGRIRSFLMHLEADRGISIPTRNLRRAGIVAFLAFASDMCPVYTNAYLEAKSIKIKKAPESKKDFLTIEEYKAMLECVDITKRNGFNHYLLISIMYDTAARVDEAVNMNLEDFTFGKESSVIIFGKGSKYRRVYLASHTVKLVKEFKQITGRETGALFLNRSNERISDSGIDHILKKYSAKASETMATLRSKIISPHVLRRTKASHMLLNGASLPVIQRFLGHASIVTTQKYLELGSDAMTKAIEKAGELLFSGNDQNCAVSSWKEQNVLQRLKGLAK
ncbi:MAG: site-specific integrase [Clostridiales bacterium]|nr:site-specific integrase [Clostridiales bacterium]